MTMTKFNFVDHLPRFVLLMAALCASSFSNAGDVTPIVRASIMLTEPWGFYENGTADADKSKLRMTGIWLEIAALVEAEANIKINKTLTPYPRIWQELENGDTDISFLIRSTDREAIVNHAGHLFDFGTVVVARKGVTLERYENLQSLRIGMLRGIRLSPTFDADTQLHKIEVRDYETLVNMLREERLDAIAGNSVSIPYLLKKLDAKQIAGKRLVLQSTPVTVHASKHYQDAKVLKQIEDAVLRLKRRNAFEAVLDRWAGKEWRVK